MSMVNGVLGLDHAAASAPHDDLVGLDRLEAGEIARRPVPAAARLAPGVADEAPGLAIGHLAEAVDDLVDAGAPVRCGRRQTDGFRKVCRRHASDSFAVARPDDSPDGVGFKPGQ